MALAGSILVQSSCTSLAGGVSEAVGDAGLSPTADAAARAGAAGDAGASGASDAGAISAADTGASGAGAGGAGTGGAGDEGAGGAAGTGSEPACTYAENGTSCGGRREICIDGACVESACGDGFVDELAGEACDDANEVPRDGCESDCSRSCTAEADTCDDGNPCNGIERCGDDFVCGATAAPDCNDDDPCTADRCDPVLGCQHSLIDADGDGHVCGDDCNDGDRSVHEGADELCDETDDDCDEHVDEGATTTFFRDCDGDGFAPIGVPSHEGCTRPTASTGCSGGGGDWVTTDPSVAPDCNDTNLSVHAGADELCNDVDDDCDQDVDEDTPRAAPDAEEANSQWFDFAANQFSGPSLPSGATGQSSVVSPPGTLTFHPGDGVDHYTWDRSYSTWNPGFQPYWMCRITGLRPGQLVIMRVGAFVPAGRTWAPTLCGTPGTMSCFSHSGLCPFQGDGGACRTQQITNPSAGAAEYGFGVSVTPVSGWDHCDADYEVECKLTENTSW